jgi:hypothetical protein
VLRQASFKRLCLTAQSVHQRVLSRLVGRRLLKGGLLHAMQGEQQLDALLVSMLAAVGMK